MLDDAVARRVRYYLQRPGLRDEPDLAEFVSGQFHHAGLSLVEDEVAVQRGQIFQPGDGIL
ncbi:MAG: hypothetical protein NT154_26255 [Verrucomicrobia bacterium]|nr:hypothetical protein [Verrucomicrobiota bacterium]